MAEQRVLDRYDLRIIHELQRDARLSHVTLSERVSLSPSQCARRLQRLEEEGVITGYHAQVNAPLLGLDVVALININLEKHRDNITAAFEEAVRQRPEITECLLVTGEGDYELRVVARNLQAFSSFITDQLMKMPGVASIRSNIQLCQIKSSPLLPLEVLDPRGSVRTTVEVSGRH
ncbi:Lrp/AsnC family transcriptional regulator [Aestuariirhabdus litorea]|uniref:Lrp/AsnC family transcriptional regulator n=1 Tax=Aestuariirhabdus litorea TaxID=2528527 RepID=A0A3P3VPY0_9GAMM|nr:Lrp/AsnC family transcriptional regulator [Aestuariirhabdus litorea]RRJ84832.1 Lrp/AsnC family transcriptional regulator [Aestuariirhabdus litorea]RWW98057.1 winged helix-turn-helix transcriptional regulator [Endozoicomonadaceae bacterium GTF-13]